MFFWTSEPGLHHKESNVKNQDSISCCTDGKYHIITLADGVSTCEKSGYGAKIACKSMQRWLLKNEDKLFDFDSCKISKDIISNVMKDINRTAKIYNCDKKSYSSTAACVIYDQEKKNIMFFNLGDSLILTVNEGKCQILSMPSNSNYGCCVTTTEKAETMSISSVIKSFNCDSTVIFSDGAWENIITGNSIRKDVVKMIENNDFEKLENFIKNQNCMDDYSFVAVNMKA